MSLDLWLAYTVAAIIVLVIPGPTIILVISQAIVHGRRSVAPLVLGVLLGDFTAMLLSILGLGAVLAASATLFSVLKWIGAVYLIYLGIKYWRADTKPDDIDLSGVDTSNRALFKSAYIVTALNPKGIAFFVAFLPQFINPTYPALPQLVLYMATFLILAVTNAGLYALFSGQLRDMLHNEKIRRWLNRCGGTALIGAGIFTAAIKPS
jgi:threonine/homoserine/homoserine lactone efflux protein